MSADATAVSADAEDAYVGGRLARWSPLSGVLFAVLFLVGSVLYDDKPSPDASDEAIVAYYTDSGNQWKIQIAYLVLTLAAVLFVWYAGTLAARLRAAEGASGWLSRIVAVSGAAFVTVMVLGFLMGEAVADIGDDMDAFRVDANTTGLVDDMSYTFTFETALPLAAPMVLAASLIFLRTALLPRWLGWAGIGVALLCFVGFLGVPMGAFLVWTVVQAVYLVVRSPRQAS